MINFCRQKLFIFLKILFKKILYWSIVDTCASVSDVQQSDLVIYERVSILFQIFEVSVTSDVPDR